MNVRNILLLAILTVSMTGCKDKQVKEAENLLTEIRNDYEAGRDSACLVAIDSLRSRCPKAVEQRNEALEYWQKASERLAQRDLEQTDKRLEEAKAMFADMERTVEQHKAELNATAEELTALTLLRMKRDSLQTRYDVLCAEIRFIHKKQKE